MKYFITLYIIIIFSFQIRLEANNSDSTFVYYEVRYGDTASKIAQLHNITMRALFMANDMWINDWKNVKVGQKLIIPHTYRVKYGESLWDIRNKYSVHPDKLYSINKDRWPDGLNHLTVKVGQTLFIPPPDEELQESKESIESPREIFNRKSQERRELRDSIAKIVAKIRKENERKQKEKEEREKNKVLLITYWCIIIFISAYFIFPDFFFKKSKQKRKKSKSYRSKKEEHKQEETYNSSASKYAEILELNGDYSLTNIKKCYKNKIKQYHPDKVDNLGKELKDLAEKRTKEINEAYKYFIGSNK